MVPIDVEFGSRGRHQPQARQIGMRGQAACNLFVELRPIAAGNYRNVGYSQQIGQRFAHRGAERSEEHTSELQSLMRISYAVFCLKKKKKKTASKKIIQYHRKQQNNKKTTRDTTETNEK